MFNHPVFRSRTRLAAVNSINWARIIAQVVYFDHRGNGRNEGNDPSTWNVGALSPCIKSFQWMVGDITQRFNRPDYAIWIQDDWKVTPRLTLNPGVRWDLSINQFANAVSVPPFLPGNRPDEWFNIGPRFG